MFQDVFADAYHQRLRKIHNDSIRANEIYNKTKEGNPNMVETGTIDFSNPASVARLQNPNMIVNPFGYYNPYSNPNMIQQPNYNPYSYLRPAYGTTWYGSYPYYSYEESTDRFMNATDEEVKSKKLARGYVSTTVEEQKPSKTYISYIERITNPNIQVKVSVKPDIQQNYSDDTEVHELNGIRYVVDKIIPEHPPHTPYTMEELNGDYANLKLISNTPLIWTKDDELELSVLVDEIAIYDKALAHLMWNLPTTKSEEGTILISREDYNYYKIYCRNTIQTYRTKEISYPNIDYKAPYRYRELPEYTYDDTGNIVITKNKPNKFPEKHIDFNGSTVYSYDRGRDTLTVQEWDIFLDKAYLDLITGAEQLKAIDTIKINDLVVKNKSSDNKKSSEVPIKYNPYDSLSSKLYYMKEAEKAYNTNMEFFKHVFRNMMTPEQFYCWWYGSKQNSDKVQNMYNYNSYQSSPSSMDSYREEMTRRNLSVLNSLVPINNQAIADAYQKRALQEINKFSGGIINKNTSLYDLMQNLPYLYNKSIETDINTRMDSYRSNGSISNRMSDNTFNSMLAYFHNNDNPNHVSQYGITYDQRVGNPSQIVDFTYKDREDYQRKLSRFVSSCSSMQHYNLT